MTPPWLDSRGCPPDVWAHLISGDLAVYEHNLRTTHPRRILVHPEKQEYVCYTCGEVLYEGPYFTDGPYPWPKDVRFPPMSLAQIGDLRRHVAKATARANA
jgi:hypothetical protein